MPGFINIRITIALLTLLLSEKAKGIYKRNYANGYEFEAFAKGFVNNGGIKAYTESFGDDNSIIKRNILKRNYSFSYSYIRFLALLKALILY